MKDLRNELLLSLSHSPGGVYILYRFAYLSKICKHFGILFEHGYLQGYQSDEATKSTNSMFLRKSSS